MRKTKRRTEQNGFPSLRGKCSTACFLSRKTPPLATRNSKQEKFDDASSPICWKDNPMQRNSASQSGVFNLRALGAIALCSVGVILGTFSFAFSQTSAALTNTSAPTSTATATTAATAAPGTPRFFSYISPQGVADSSGEPSIGSNWTRDAISNNHNVNGSINNIPNGGTSLYFGGFSPAMAKVTWDDCSSPAGALWENKPLLSANTPRAAGDPILFTLHDTGRTFVAQLEGLTPAGSTIDITDDDGDHFTPSDGVVPSEIDLNNTIPATRDPSVGVATDGTIYFGYQAANGHPMVAVSHDKGLNWSASVDVGAAVVNGGPVLNATFPATVAGDPNRAAFTFYGSETPGTNWDCGQGTDCGHGANFAGVWYLYVATTFDGGATWTTQNVTPGDPVQRGGICQSGTCRNLLDFYDATVDKEGRILIGYEDGCISAACINGGANDFTAKGVIARQSGGMRMFGAFDPIEPAVPGAPKATGTANQDGTATLNWSAPDNGGSAVTAYNIYRSIKGGPFTLIATVPVTNYTDASFATKDVYHVTAINQAGEGPYCPDVAPVRGVTQTPCVLPGVLAINDLNPDGSDNDGGANTPPDPRVNVRQLFVAEPDFGRDNNGNTIQKLVFTMQLAPSSAGSAPASSQWYTVWTRQGKDPSDPNDSHFDRLWIGMKSDATGALSFQYGKFGVPLDATNPDTLANTPVTYGNADSGTYDVASGVVRITISNSKLRSIDGGATKYVANTSLGAINVRTYLARPDAGQKSQNNASDITGNGAYTLVGNAFCYVNRLPVASLSASRSEE